MFFHKAGPVNAAVHQYIWVTLCGEVKERGDREKVGEERAAPVGGIKFVRKG